MKRKKIFYWCLTFSLFLHLTALIFFQRYSLWFSSPKPQHELKDWLNLVDKKERNEILKVAFSPQAEKKVEKLLPQKEELALSLRSSVSIEESPPSKSSLFQTPESTPLKYLLAANHALPTFSISSDPLNLLDHLPKDLMIPVSLEKTSSPFHPFPTEAMFAMNVKPPVIQLEAPHFPKTEPTVPRSEPLSEKADLAKTPSLIPLPALPTLPNLAELETSSYSDSFDGDLVFLPKEEGGYIFALTLIPRPDLELPRIKQHITFLIDKSNSIQQGRLSATKSAVLKTLHELSPYDTFNIIAFDNKIEKLSPNYIPCTSNSFSVAEQFLDKIQLGSFFSSCDLYRPLFLTVPGQAGDDEIHTAILLTDGESFTKKPSIRSILHDWSKYNNGKVTLFALGVGGDPYASTLDTIAAFNRGKYSYAPTHRSLKRKLLKLVKSVQNPVAKNISCKAISRLPQTKIELFPKPSQFPHLYLDQPYVILGSANTLDDFILFVQGRSKGRWVNIKKTISFVNARKGNKSLKQEWALQKAYELYEQYTLDENPKHLADAKTLLEPFDFQVAIR